MKGLLDKTKGLVFMGGLATLATLLASWLTAALLWLCENAYTWKIWPRLTSILMFTAKHWKSQ